MSSALFNADLMAETPDGPRLVGKRCKKCGRIIFPSGDVCTKCFSDEAEETTFGAKGTLFSYTTTYAPSANLTPPFAVGYIQTDGGTRVFAPLSMEDADDFRIGADVRLTFAELWEQNGEPVKCYQYRICK